MSKAPRILVYICTCNRYDTTLPMAMLSIIQQTRKPDKIMIFDDSRDDAKKDPRKIEHLNYLFRLMDQKGIPWEWIWAKKLGAHHSHEMANMAGFDLAWFIDDDCVAEPTCLEKLLWEMRDGVGAVGSLILQPPAKPLPPGITHNKIDDIVRCPNIQWFTWGGKPVEVEHIYSQFLYRCGIVHHDLNLSSVVFRGETMFTHSLYLKGYKLIVAPDAVTWHFQGKGGIHDGQKAENWKHDDEYFRRWLAFKRSGERIYVLNNGLGDHYMFLQAITPPPGSLISCCYPDIFPPGYRLISIEAAKQLVNLEEYDVYKWCANRQWKGTLIEAFKALYEDLHRSR